MNRKEAMAALCEGKKIRRSCWPSDAYYKFAENGKLVDHEGKCSGVQFMDKPNWEIFEDDAEKLAEALKEIQKLKNTLLIEYARANLDQDRQKLMQQQIDSLQKTVKELQTALERYTKLDMES